MALGNDVHLIPVRLDALRPTQMTVGYREVKAKRRHWKALDKRARKAAIDSHWFPAVLGPGGLYYITDHHHLGLVGEHTVGVELRRPRQERVLPRYPLEQR